MLGGNMLLAEAEAVPLEPMLQAITLTIAVLALVSIGAILIVWFRRGLTNSDDDTSHTILAEFRRMEEEGELSPEEFAQIKRKMADKIKQTGTKSATKKKPLQAAPLYPSPLPASDREQSNGVAGEFDLHREEENEADEEP